MKIQNLRLEDAGAASKTDDEDDDGDDEDDDRDGDATTKSRTRPAEGPWKKVDVVPVEKEDGRTEVVSKPIEVHG